MPYTYRTSYMLNHSPVYRYECVERGHVLDAWQDPETARGRELMARECMICRNAQRATARGTCRCNGCR